MSAPLLLAFILITTTMISQGSSTGCSSDRVCSYVHDCPKFKKELLDIGRVPEGYDCSAEGDRNVMVCCRRSDVRKKTTSSEYCSLYRHELMKNSGASQHIRNGKDTEQGEFPHVAALGYVDRSYGGGIDWGCTASLISENWVLTAAHCILESLKYVGLGAHDLNGIGSGQGKVMKVSYAVGHEEYNKNGFGFNDIGLVRFEGSIPEFTNLISPACLYEEQDLPSGNLTIVGYGKTGPRGTEHTYKARKGVVQEIKMSECSDFFSKSGIDLNYGNTDSMICARDRGVFTEACPGDSGGPIQVPMDDTFYILGVTSVGSSGCKKQFYSTASIYTRVSHFLPWIERIVWGSGADLPQENNYPRYRPTFRGSIYNGPRHFIQRPGQQPPFQVHNGFNLQNNPHQPSLNDFETQIQNHAKQFELSNQDFNRRVELRKQDFNRRVGSGFRDFIGQSDNFNDDDSNDGFSNDDDSNEDTFNDLITSDDTPHWRAQSVFSRRHWR